MNADESNEFLTAAAVIDPKMKRVDIEDRLAMTKMWALMLPEVSMDEALWALRDHYRESRDAIMPADVLRRVGARRASPRVLSGRDAWLLSQNIDPDEYDALVAAGNNPVGVLASYGVTLPHGRIES